jgi:hypothetical protein
LVQAVQQVQAVAVAIPLEQIHLLPLMFQQVAVEVEATLEELMVALAVQAVEVVLFHKIALLVQAVLELQDKGLMVVMEMHLMVLAVEVAEAVPLQPTQETPHFHLAVLEQMLIPLGQA